MTEQVQINQTQNTNHVNQIIEKIKWYVWWSGLQEDIQLEEIRKEKQVILKNKNTSMALYWKYFNKITGFILTLDFKLDNTSIISKNNISKFTETYKKDNLILKLTYYKIPHNEEYYFDEDRYLYLITKIEILQE